MEVSLQMYTILFILQIGSAVPKLFMQTEVLNSFSVFFFFYSFGDMLEVFYGKSQFVLKISMASPHTRHAYFKRSLLSHRANLGQLQGHCGPLWTGKYDKTDVTEALHINIET